MNRTGRTNNAVHGSTIAMGVVLALGAVVGLTLRTFARTQEADRDQAGDPTAESELMVSVTVYNYAPVPEATLLKSEAETRRIFAKAGVKVAWRNCAILGKQVDCLPRDHPSAAAKMHLNILPDSMAKRLSTSDSDGGFATECPAGESGCQAYVFYDCAVDLVRAGCSGALGRVGCADAALWQILGAMAAHELGHLLLGVHAHSPLGIMHPQWIARDFKAAAQGQLVFTTQQAEQLQAELRRRMLRPSLVQLSGCGSSRKCPN